MRILTQTHRAQGAGHSASRPGWFGCNPTPVSWGTELGRKSQDNLRAQDGPQSEGDTGDWPLPPGHRIPNAEGPQTVQGARAWLLGQPDALPRDSPLSPRKGNTRSARGSHICRRRKVEDAELQHGGAGWGVRQERPPELSPRPWPRLGSAASGAGAPLLTSPPLERPGLLENLAQRWLWPGDLPVGTTAPQSQKGPQEKACPPALQGPPHLEGRLPRAQRGLQVLLVPWRHLTQGLGLGGLVLHVPAACSQGDQLIPDEPRALFTPSLPSPASPPPPLPPGPCAG